MKMLIKDPNELKKYAPKERLWQGIPSIEVSKNGRYFSTFYSGGTMEEIGNYILLYTSEDGKDFSHLEMVVYEEGQRCFDPVLWIDPLGRLWLLWGRLPDYGVFATVCQDPDAEALDFCEPFCITRDACVMMNRPTVWSTGEWLVPVTLGQPYFMKGCWHVNLPEGMPVGAKVLKSSDNGQTFSILGKPPKQDKDYSFEEQMILERRDGSLMMLVRTYYGIGVSYSYNRGESWTDVVPSHIAGPDSRFHIRRLPSGRVLLINHYKFTGRNRSHMTALLSEDDGATFPYSLLLDERMNVSYPDCTVAPDGSILITYDRERGAWAPSFDGLYSCAREILLARIREEDILTGKLVSEGSYLRRIVSKLGKYAHEDENVYGEWSRYTCEEAAEKLAMGKTDKEEILDMLFLHYAIPCMRASGIDVFRFDAIFDAFRKKEGVDLSLLSLLIHTLREGTRTEDEGPIVTRIKELIAKNLTEDTPAEALAERLGISFYYMHHLFKRETGTTIGAYRRSLRMMLAKRLLISTDRHVADVAADAGYTDASYFARVFTENEGISPSKYRALHKK